MCGDVILRNLRFSFYECLGMQLWLFDQNEDRSMSAVKYIPNVKESEHTVIVVVVLLILI